MNESPKWKPYNPNWLVKLAREQRPNEQWLFEALSGCTIAWESEFTVYFIDPSHPNQRGSEWQFETNVILEHPEEGDIVIDILKGKRIGGIEFLTKVSRGQ